MSLKDLLFKEHKEGEHWVNLAWGIAVTLTALEYGAILESYRGNIKGYSPSKNTSVEYVAQSR